MSAAPPLDSDQDTALKVFITGASSGIGRALAEHYAGQGARLGLVARREHLLDSLAKRWPGQTVCFSVDVTDAPALASAADAFTTRFGAPDIVIANAGVSVGTLTEHAADLEAIRRVIEVNLFGIAATFSPFIAAMRQAGSGRLVGIASVAGIRGLPGAGAYSASKAAAISYLESLRIELRGSGVRVVTICPGYVETPMTEGNPFPMPFLMPAEEAAQRFSRAIARGDSYRVIPWQMALAARLLRMLPNAIYDRLLTRAPRKPRNSDTAL
ncbi:SDR family oxidoreductase [Accumulibacter sp.]|uniref:SDR family oxidoreductase n=1 Tax=Accumulibacter sp. TaxID=2053492 RepID=UPI0025E3FD9E|nr:SDR family oxidoreductase [Accumulibacter sp.]MCM8595200.1 SDR family oxidoreductase [Accumulibacter sp.]MCM8625186.1 SDR family oxidoreductase [Accumulibacter sp.]MDS4049346.1 SDR family oxidoreductase [Accumulibacter sp.]